MAIQNTDPIKIKLDISWCDENKAFLAISADYPAIVGAAATKKEAVEIFYKHLNAWHEHEKTGKIAKNKGGRPKKNNSAINVNISKEAKVFLSYYCIQNNVKPGELINNLILNFAKSTI